MCVCTSTHLSYFPQGDFWLGQLQSHPSGDGGRVQAGGQPLPFPRCWNREGNMFLEEEFFIVSVNYNSTNMSTLKNFVCFFVLFCFVCISSRASPKSFPCPSLSQRSTHRSKSSSMPALSSPSHSTAGWSLCGHIFYIKHIWMCFTRPLWPLLIQLHRDRRHVEKIDQPAVDKNSQQLPSEPHQEATHRPDRGRRGHTNIAQLDQDFRNVWILSIFIVAGADHHQHHPPGAGL